jgi:hypothetical protein
VVHGQISDEQIPKLGTMYNYVNACFEEMPIGELMNLNLSRCKLIERAVNVSIIRISTNHVAVPRIILYSISRSIIEQVAPQSYRSI